MNPRRTFAKLRAEAQRHTAYTVRLRLDFIATEIEITKTFINLALTAYRMQHRDSGRRLQEKAAVACAEAEKQIQKAEEYGADVEQLREQLSQATEALNQLTLDGENRRTDS